MPEEAIRAYEQALALGPANVALIQKIGRALVQMHDFKRAVAYYAQVGAGAGAAGGAGPY